MNVGVFIPVRLESSRLPGKALVDIHGLPMLAHVVRRVALAEVGPVYVATDSEEIARAAEGEPARVLMTSTEHQTGSDRLAEAVDATDAEIVINVQGDEALVRPEHVARMAELMTSDAAVECALLTCRMGSLGPSDIKVVTDLEGRVLYLSRADVPFHRDGSNPPRLKAYHVVGFRREFLKRYASLPRTPLEMAEYNEYLRILEHGHRIHTAEVDRCATSVDTPEDLEKVRRLFEADDIFPKYR